MAETPSTMSLKPGIKAPDFTLPDTISGNSLSLSQLAGQKATLIMFLCNHCPFVKHVKYEIAAIGKQYSDKGVQLIAISSNDVVHYPQDAPDKMREEAREAGYTFPYLYDESQQVAKDYDAACTPDFFLFDADLQLVYRGQLDDSRPNNGKPVTGKDVRAALDAILAGKPVSEKQLASIGCNIKWKN